MKPASALLYLAVSTLFLSGCAMVPGGVAASNTPINGRKYTEVGYAKKTDSRIYLLGLIPISGSNSTRDAIDNSIKEKRGDAMINITVEAYSQWWILFSRYVTRVEGNVIRFQ